MSSQFNFYLNRQGVPGKQGEKGNPGFSPIITVASDTPSEYILQIQTENNIFETSNLREHKEDLGGTYLRYNRDTGVTYIGEATRGDENNFGVVKFANSSDISSLDDTVATTPFDVNGMIEGKEYEARFTSDENRISTNEGDISNLKGRVSANENDIASLKSRVSGTESDITALKNRATTDEGLISANANDIDNIEALIPAQATIANQLSDKAFVNSSIATNTANFIGTFNSVADLEAYSGTVTNNDYAFVVSTDTAGNTVYNRYKYTIATTPASWVFEYALNNSSFTANQWAAINSGATTTNIGQIATNANDISSLQTSVATKLSAVDLQTYLQAGSNISFSISGNVITINGQAGGGSTYSAGTGIDITNNVISVQSDLISQIASMQELITQYSYRISQLEQRINGGNSSLSGSNISISNLNSSSLTRNFSSSVENEELSSDDSDDENNTEVER